MIARGLSAVKDRLAQMVRELHPRSNQRGVEEAELAVKFNWSDVQAGLPPATRMTALNRYQTWYYETFCGTKHFRSDNAKYQASDSESIGSFVPHMVMRRRLNLNT